MIYIKIKRKESCDEIMIEKWGTIRAVGSYDNFKKMMHDALDFCYANYSHDETINVHIIDLRQ